MPYYNWWRPNPYHPGMTGGDGIKRPSYPGDDVVEKPPPAPRPPTHEWDPDNHRWVPIGTLQPDEDWDLPPGQGERRPWPEHDDEDTGHHDPDGHYDPDSHDPGDHGGHDPDMGTKRKHGHRVGTDVSALWNVHRFKRKLR